MTQPGNFGSTLIIPQIANQSVIVKGYAPRYNLYNILLSVPVNPPYSLQTAEISIKVNGAVVLNVVDILRNR